MGLRTKAMISLGTLVCCALLLMGLTIYYQSRTLAVGQLLETSGQKLETDCVEIQGSLDAAKADLAVLEGIPPIQGILRAKAHGGRDPESGDSYDQWLMRLERIFSVFMSNRTGYAYLIFSADDGSEFMRIDSNGRVTSRTREDNPGGIPPYVTETMNYPRGRVYYSSIGPDRGKDPILAPYSRLFTIAVPVYDKSERFKGSVAIQMYVGEFFGHIRSDWNGVLRFVLDEAGHYIVRPYRPEGPHNDRPPVLDEPSFGLKIKTDDLWVGLDGERSRVDGFRKLFYDPADRGRYWTVVYQSPTSLAFKGLRTTQWTMLFAGILIAVFSVIVIAVIASKKVLTPVMTLADAARRMEKGDLSTRLPEDTADGEFRTLYRTVNAFAESQQNAIEQFERDLAARTAELSAANARLAEDLDAIRNAEEALQSSETRYRRLFETAKDGILVLDEEAGVITDVNPALTEMLGYSRHDLIGREPWVIFPLDEMDVNMETFRQLLSAGSVRREDLPLEKKDGRRISVEFVSNVYLSSDRKVIQCNLRDITERKRHGEERRKLTEDLLRSNEELQHFAYVASHDLQEPLRMISSYLQLLARRYKGRLDTDADEFIDYAVDGAKRMQNMIVALLSYARVGTHGGELKEVDAGAALGAALDNLKLAVEDSGAQVTHDPLPTVPADESQLTQLFQNLISNSLKFRGTGPPIIHVSARRDGGYWVFSVKDNGIGIDTEYGERIFRIFQRLHGKGDYPGTGIGLSICKKIVERHGGRIWIESAPGEGATFYFTLPVLL
jgi:PAS domain S-box-containing protein